VILIFTYNYEGVLMTHTVQLVKPKQQTYKCQCQCQCHDTYCSLWNYGKCCVLPELSGTPFLLHSASYATSSAFRPYCVAQHSQPCGQAVTDLFKQRIWEILDHPPHKSEMSSCDYNLFQKLKRTLGGI
jgi:hypothetical protein